jgi:hypothetical protein
VIEIALKTKPLSKAEESLLLVEGASQQDQPERTRQPPVHRPVNPFHGKRH